MKLFFSLEYVNMEASAASQSMLGHAGLGQTLSGYLLKIYCNDKCSVKSKNLKEKFKIYLKNFIQLAEEMFSISFTMGPF